MPETQAIETVAVIGAGARGRAFAFLCIEAGLTVVLEDVLSSNLRKAEAEFAHVSPVVRSKLALAGSVEDAVRQADVAIDFVPDELESKLEIFSMMDRMAPPRTIFCTPTTLSIADLASCTYRPSLCLGVTPFGDHLGASVQLVRGQATAPEAIAEVSRWFSQLGARPEVISDAAEPSLVGR